MFLVKAKLSSPPFLLAVGVCSAVSVLGCYLLLDWLTYNYRVPWNIFVVIQFVPLGLLLISAAAIFTSVGIWSKRVAGWKLTAGAVILVCSFLISAFTSAPNIHGPFAVTVVFFAMAVLIGGLLVIIGAVRWILTRRKALAQE